MAVAVGLAVETVGAEAVVDLAVAVVVAVGLAVETVGAVEAVVGAVGLAEAAVDLVGVEGWPSAEA